MFEYASEWDLKEEEKKEQPGWKLCLAYAYFFHWFEAGYAYKCYTFKTYSKQVIASRAALFQVGYSE